jgi:glycosyltransferase involved in cell wall biosynthesis
MRDRHHRRVHPDRHLARAELFGDAGIQGPWAEVEAVFHNRFREAVAAGLPVIVSDASPGPLEMVEPGVHGLVVPSDNVDALAAGLARLMADPALRQQLGEAGRARLQSLEWPQVEPLWRSVLALPEAP